jgi:hypothetical protein
VQLAIDDLAPATARSPGWKKLRPDVLKIDKSFTSAIGIDSVNATVTDMIIALAHRLNIVTVAEGVETQEQEVSARPRRRFPAGILLCPADAGRGLSAVAGGGKASGDERIKCRPARGRRASRLLFFVVVHRLTTRTRSTR